MEKSNLVFVGTYTTGSSLGIYIYRMDTATGALTQIGSSPSGKASNPSYLAIHPNKKWIYAVAENSPGSVNAFSFDTVQNKMTFLNTQSAKGDAPCYISIDKTGRYVLVACYNSGSVAVLPINADGSLGASTSSDKHTGTGHAHMIMQAVNGYVYNTDLGLDKIYIYKLDSATGILTDNGNDASSQAGAGPRHMAFHPTQPWLYVVCELGRFVEAYTINNTTGGLTRFQSITTGAPGGTHCADIHMTPDGKYLYASNRDPANNITMYSIDQSTGQLTSLGTQATLGNTPRNFVIDPSGTFLLVANQGGNNVVTFKINPSTGRLSETGNQITVPSPVCVKFFPKGNDASAIRNFNSGRMNTPMHLPKRMKGSSLRSPLSGASANPATFDLQGKSLMSARGSNSCPAPAIIIYSPTRGE